VEAESDSKWGTLLPATQVVKTFLLHSESHPLIQDSNHVLCSNGTQALRLTNLVPSHPRYAVVYDSTNVGSYAADHPDWFQYRLEVNDSGSAQSYFLSVLQARDASGADLTTTLAEDGVSYTVTLTHPMRGTAVVKFQKGMISSGGEFGYAASGTHALAPLAGSIQGIMVTDSGPVWDPVPSMVAEKITLPDAYSLNLDARPNPFHSFTRISFRIAKISAALPIRLSVYDEAGKRMAVLVARSLLAGKHVVDWNAAGMPSGVYVFKLTIGNSAAIKKGLLLK
jgi:hypothetical protein